MNDISVPVTCGIATTGVMEYIDHLCDQAKILMEQNIRHAQSLLREALVLCIPAMSGIPENSEKLEPAPTLPHEKVWIGKMAWIHYLLGSTFARQAEFTQGHEALQTALSYSRTAEDVSLQIRVLNLTGILAQVQGKGIKQVLHPLKQALRLACTQGNLNEVGDILASISKVYCALGHYTRAQKYVHRSLEIYRAENLQDGEATALILLGQILCTTGETDKALEAFLAALRILELLDKHQSAALVYMNIGNVYFVLGEYAETLRYQIRSLTLYEKIGDPLGCSDVLSNIGNTYSQLYDSTMALAYYERALALKQTLDNTPGEALLLNNIAAEYANRKNYDEAYTYMSRSLALFKSVDDRNGTAVALVNIGIFYLERHDFAAAYEHLYQALTLYQTMSEKSGEMNALFYLGQLSIRQGNHTVALDYLRHALDLAEAIKEKKKVYLIHEYLSEACEAIGDRTAALKHYRIFHRIKEEIFNEESDRRRRTLQLHYEVEKSRKEADIERLQREQLEREMELKNRELTATTMLLAQKNGILQDLYQRVRSLCVRPDKEQTERMRALLLQLESHLHSSQTWEAFEQHFTHIHGAFYSTLRQRCTTLSPAELKVCALIKLNLSMKEIAALLTITDTTVKKHRYNIRKKLGLADGESLTMFLAST